jgi:hypothetical protein
MRLHWHKYIYIGESYQQHFITNTLGVILAKVKIKVRIEECAKCGKKRRI